MISPSADLGGLNDEVDSVSIAPDGLDSQGPEAFMNPREYAVYLEALQCTGWSETEKIAFLKCPNNRDLVWEYNKCVRRRIKELKIADTAWLRRSGGQVR